MPTLNALDPTPEQIKAFLAHKKSSEPVFMVNLLKFKDKATYKDAHKDGEDISGREAYGRYAAGFSEIMKGKGVETIYGGNANVFMIGQGEGEWDSVAVVKYPNAKSMLEAVSSDEYRKIHKHRRAGLAGQLLISCDNEKVF